MWAAVWITENPGCDYSPRAEILAAHYSTKVYETTEALLADRDVEIVVNLTDPQNHYAVSKASLLAGKHVYSEKPLSTDFEQAKELVALADEKGLVLSSAPCSVLSETAQTLWAAVRDGAIGRPQLVYAELDDNPVYLMHPEGWANERGIPWPYLNEFETGCTLEHAGYYLTWMAAMFGPAESVTAFSHCVVPDKADKPLDPPDTPDLSIACILFESGVVARLTCSIVAPYNHALQIVGDEGVLTCDECWHYGAPVRLERFSQLSLNVRKSRSVRASAVAQALFGVGGRKQKFVQKPQPQWATRYQDVRAGRRGIRGAVKKAVWKHEFVSMDFFRGVDQMAKSIEGKPASLLPSDFVLHVNELALAIQAAGTTNGPYELTTTFEPLAPTRPDGAPTYGARRSGLLTPAIEKLIKRLHRH